MTKRNRRFIVRRFICTYLILMLLISGCADRYGQVLKPTNERFEISRTHSEFSELANSENMPIKHISEGKIGVSKVEAALESSDAADFRAQRTEMEAQINQKLAKAEALRKRCNKEYSKAMAQISARESELEALIGLKDANVASLVK